MQMNPWGTKQHRIRPKLHWHHPLPVFPFPDLGPVWGGSQDDLVMLAVSQNISLVLVSPPIPGCYPHCRRMWCEGGRGEGGGGGVERERKGSWKQKPSVVIGCLDRGQSEDRRRAGEGVGGWRTGRGEGEIVLKPFKCPPEGSRGCQVCGASPCRCPSVYLSLPICVRPSTCPVFVPTLYMCVCSSA